MTNLLDVLGTDALSNDFLFSDSLMGALSASLDITEAVTGFTPFEDETHNYHERNYNEETLTFMSIIRLNDIQDRLD